MSDMGDCVATLFALVLAFIVGGCSGACLGIGSATRVEHSRAIDAGVGQWVIDSKTGESKFEYGVENGQKK